MAYTTKFLFSLLCIPTVIYSSESQDTALSFDATEFYNNSITKIFRTVDHENVKTLVASIENRNATNFETPVALQIGPFENKFFFTGINVSVKYFGLPQMQYDFSNREIVIFNPKFSIVMETYVGASRNVSHAGFILLMYFENISIKAKMPAENSPQDKFQIDISYDDLMFDYIYLPWFRGDLSLELQNELENRTRQTLPSVLTYNLNHNANFLQNLNRTFCTLMATRELQLRDPLFRKRELAYYYRLREVSSFHIALSNIVANGLSNFECLTFDNTSSIGDSIYNLTIRNIRGIATLCYKNNPLGEKVFNLTFNTDFLSILFNQAKGRVNVEAQKYSVNLTESNTTLTKERSDWIMEGISRAIALSIMPSMEVCRNKNELSGALDNTHPVVKLLGEISDQFHWTRMSEAYKKCIPFEGNHSTMVDIIPDPDASNCTISVRRLELKSILPNRFPFQMECYFFEKLVLIYDVDGNATGTIRLHPATENPVDVNFTARFSFSDQIIKHTQDTNDSYEFKVWLSYLFDPVIITLAPIEYQYQDGEELQIRQKINETLISMVRELMLQDARPFLSLPLDFCTTPHEINRDFLPPFADYQAPYHIPNGKMDGGKYFTQKIYNITLFGLSNFTFARVGFNKDDIPQVLYSNGADDSDEDSDEVIGTYIEFPIKHVTGRMNFNDSSVKFSEMLLERLDELLVVNATSRGKVSLFPDFKCRIVPVPYDAAFSRYDSMWIMEKLEDIVEHSMNERKADFLYSLY